MSRLIYFLFSALLVIACQTKNQQSKTKAVDKPDQHQYAMAIHGGAGYMKKGMFSDSTENAYKMKLKEAVTHGNRLLADGKSAVIAVKETLMILEDSPLFNAGKGAVFTNDENNELDASIMDGNTLNAGAVAGVQRVKNPISLAHQVMINSKHVLLAREGAEAFAESQGEKLVNPEYFFTKNRFESLQRAKSEGKGQASVLQEDFKFGTVGCVALDKRGHLAAGTSTGGMTNKEYARIGDSPIIGAGTYANDKTCAVSSTGHGEYFIRGVVAYDISALMAYQSLSLKKATQKVIQEKLPDLGGDGGVVALDHYGNVSFEFNTSGMFRAYTNDKDELEIGIYATD
ncbi:MAG: isoaspartyl peptidase/L-asparaginase [Psychroflexus sp.]|nr:isoaspartyl peptidase/L-asparaginase [Psychroflexus sp.]MDR9448609.1 isoaspartyl peptidase/L-asparaginase [Psychroflexus sp.]